MNLFCSFFLSLVLATTGQYVEDFARNVMYRLAAGAMITNPELCMKEAVADATLKRKIVVECDSLNDTCSGYTGYIPSQNAIVISFRGTDGDFEFEAEVYQILLGQQQTFPGGAKVANFFYLSFLGIWNAGMKDDFLTLKQQNPNSEIWITGHSLGASMASLCAGYIVQLGLATGDQIKLYTFGEPRTGDSNYAALINNLLPIRYRVVHANDMIPHIPLPVENYEHHANEIWYNNAMNIGDPYTICNGNEDPKCSASVPVNQWDPVNAHGDYYGINIGTLEYRNCVFVNQEHKENKRFLPRGPLSSSIFK